MTQPRKVLVTGAAGFIGSTLVEGLLAEGRELVTGGGASAQGIWLEKGTEA